MAKIDRVGAVRRGDHLLVQLLARANADDRCLALGRDRLRDITDAVARNLGHEDLAAHRLLYRPKDHVDTLLQGDVEPGHFMVGDRQRAACTSVEEERNDRSAASHDVAVAHNREAKVALATDVVGRGEQLVRAELGRTVQIDRGGRLVSRQRDDTRHVRIQARLDQVLGTEYVGLDAFKRIVLGGRHLLQRRGVDHNVDPLQCPTNPVSIAHVANEVTQLRIFLGRENLRHLELLKLVSREDDQTFDVGKLVEDSTYEGPAEGASAACDEKRLAVEHSVRFHVYCRASGIVPTTSAKLPILGDAPLLHMQNPIAIDDHEWDSVATELRSVPVPVGSVSLEGINLMSGIMLKLEGIL